MTFRSGWVLKNCRNFASESQKKKETPMAVKKMYLLPGGIVTLDRSILLTGVDMGLKIKAPVFSVLLIHDQGPSLIDCGLHPDALTDPEHTWGPRAKVSKPEMTAEDDIRRRLKALNLEVSDIKQVISTHLHWDHTGGLKFFTHCPIIVQKDEYRFAFHPDSFVAAQYMANHFPSDLNYQLLDGDQIIAPGISVIRTPGHTPGHQSVLIQMESGASFIFAGDVISLQENVAKKIPNSNTWNAQQSVESLYRLDYLSRLLGAEIIPSHDMNSWEKLKKSPDFYR
jgi:N-acyl homoserine lactone hydrolase